MMTMESVNKLMMSGVESAAQMSVGQALIRMVDKVMWIIEKSVQWSLPPPEAFTEENGESFGKPELVRPLPWIVFLPTILMLRVFRASLNAVAVVLGYPTVQPTDMIHAIQRGRRRLRAIKSSGLKSMRQKKTPAAKDKPMSMREASRNLAKSIRLTLSTLSCLDSGSKSPSPPPTKIRVSNYLDMSTQMPEGKMKDEDGILSPKGDVKRKYSELSDESSDSEYDDETVLSKIDRLVDDPGSDKDYNPNESTTSDLSDSVDSDPDVSISMSEVQDLNENGDLNHVILPKTPEKPHVQIDSETNKSCNEAGTAKHVQLVERPQHLAVSGWENGSEEAYASGNGVSTETDTDYYSPISWKSISPELSPVNKNNQIDVERKPEELNNGELNKKEKKDHDRNEACIKGNETLANGLAKEKHRSPSSHSGGSQKHHKHKRGNHGHRKKK